MGCALPDLRSIYRKYRNILLLFFYPTATRYYNGQPCAVLVVNICWPAAALWPDYPNSDYCLPTLVCIASACHAFAKLTASRPTSWASSLRRCLLTWPRCCITIRHLVLLPRLPSGSLAVYLSRSLSLFFLILKCLLFVKVTSLWFINLLNPLLSPWLPYVSCLPAVSMVTKVFSALPPFPVSSRLRCHYL